MKLAVIGGGSTYTPELVDGIARLSDDVKVEELVLVDPDETRLSVVGPVSSRIMRTYGHPAQLTWTTNLDEGLDGAGAVLLQLRAGGPAARRNLAAGIRLHRPGDHRRRRVRQGTPDRPGRAGHRRAGPAASPSLGVDHRLHQPGGDRDPGPAGRGPPGPRAVQRGHRVPAALRRHGRRRSVPGPARPRRAQSPDLGAGGHRGRGRRAARPY